METNFFCKDRIKAIISHQTDLVKKIDYQEKWHLRFLITNNISNAKPECLVV